MSHFNVLVIGNNPEKALAPYHEFECDGVDDEYVVENDISDEIIGDIGEMGSLAEAVIYNLGDDSIVSDSSEVDLTGAHKFGYAIIKDNTLVKAVRRTNPNKKWDWYQCGGRWSGFFLNKDGIWVDSVKKSELDLAGMEMHSAIQAKRSYEQYAEAIAGHEQPKSWETVRNDITDITEARKIYGDQPAIKSIKKNDIGPLFSCAVEYFGNSEMDFVVNKVNSCLTPYAVICDGEWHSKGEMGWFGMSNDNLSQDEWNKRVLELIKELPEETNLSLYDCHI